MIGLKVMKSVNMTDLFVFIGWIDFIWPSSQLMKKTIAVTEVYVHISPLSSTLIVNAGHRELFGGDVVGASCTVISGLAVNSSPSLLTHYSG